MFTTGQGIPADIGPGKYDSSKPTLAPQYKQRGMSCFVSRVPKTSTDARQSEEGKKVREDPEEEDEEEEDIEVPFEIFNYFLGCSARPRLLQSKKCIRL